MALEVAHSPRPAGSGSNLLAGMFERLSSGIRNTPTGGAQVYKISSGGSLTLGYSVHNLLTSCARFSGRMGSTKDDVPLYDGRTEFNLSYEELKEVNTFISDLLKWYSDFQLIMESLLGDDNANYIQLAQKPLREIIIGEEKRGECLIAPSVYATTSTVRAKFNGIIAYFGIIEI